MEKKSQGLLKNSQTCPKCGKPMVQKDVVWYCSDPACPNSKPVQPHKCDGCKKDFEPWDVHSLEWRGVDLQSKDKTESLWLLPSKKLGTYCAECSEKIEAFLSSLNAETNHGDQK